MFLHLLKDNQKLEFLKLARRMIDADDVALDTEKAYLYRLFREAGLRAHDREVPRDAIADPAVFDSRRARVAAAVEMLVLALIDGDFDANEKAMADEILEQFGIGDDDQADIGRAADNIVEAYALVSKLTD